MNTDGSCGNAQNCFTGAVNIGNPTDSRDLDIWQSFIEGSHGVPEIGFCAANATVANTLWHKTSEQALFVRKLGSQKNSSYETYRTYFQTRPPETVANILVCIIHQTNYLLDRQIRQLEKAFIEEGGLSERMTRARIARRAGHPESAV